MGLRVCCETISQLGLDHTNSVEQPFNLCIWVGEGEGSECSFLQFLKWIWSRRVSVVIHFTPKLDCMFSESNLNRWLFLHWEIILSIAWGWYLNSLATLTISVVPLLCFGVSLTLNKAVFQTVSSGARLSSDTVLLVFEVWWTPLVFAIGLATLLQINVTMVYQIVQNLDRFCLLSLKWLHCNLYVGQDWFQECQGDLILSMCMTEHISNVAMLTDLCQLKVEFQFFPLAQYSYHRLNR